MTGAAGWLSAMGRERARPARLREWPHAWWLAVGTVCFGAFMGQLDASIVTLTYQPLQAQFHTSLAATQWVSLSYLLTLATLLIPIGRLSDAHGRKLLYLYGFVVFTAASAACALAPSLGALIAFRVVQAVGAAMLQANSVALVTTSAPPERMRFALGLQATAQAVGLALGPTVGGLLVSTLGWRWVFGVNVPIGVVAVLAGIYLLPRTRHRTPVNGWDGIGLGLLGVAITSLLLGISAASGLALPMWATVALLGLAAGTGAAFWRRQQRAAQPLLNVALLRNPAVAGGLLGGLGGYLVLFGPLVLVPVVLTGAGSSALHAGLVLTALPAGFAVAAAGSERLLPACWSDRARAMLGALGAAVALAVLLLVPFIAAWLVPVLVVLGLALGTFLPANNAIVMGAIPVRSAGTGGGLVNMTRSLGTALGVAFVTLALHLGPAGEGPRLAAAVLAAVAVVAAATAVRAPRDPAA
ncbi:MFS transporter [Pseudonocardia acidicola]|uniref:MFS transporter n=1 Tax=Pseudonocardia acidicola TaxID=2724939 RepID=A0ABX1S3R9_9PSEU|nr:MFS transporter [Pseudonocardia acidicola]NMH96185.1 MFS transporter [Pseudonocardia acidicola]